MSFYAIRIILNTLLYMYYYLLHMNDYYKLSIPTVCSPASSVNETFMFVGGVPMEYQSTNFAKLALPSVIFEPVFEGTITNLFYRSVLYSYSTAQFLLFVCTRSQSRVNTRNKCFIGSVLIQFYI